MRLTLRTLLAYRDGVLSSEDQADLHRRIQENPHVANLLRRIEELSNSHRIYSPKLEESGAGDPNVVAEYLDDALTNDLVAELERLCLEKSEYLSELASCHHLLAEAMQNQVAVPKSLQGLAIRLGNVDVQEQVRQKLADQSHSAARLDGKSVAKTVSKNKEELLKEASASESSAALKVNVEAPMVASGGETIKQAGLNLEDKRLAHEVPEYLIASGWQRWQLPGLILALAASLVLLLWYSLGSVESIRQLWNDDSTTGPLATAELAPRSAEERLQEPGVERDEAGTADIPPRPVELDQSDTTDSSVTGQRSQAEDSDGLASPEVDRGKEPVTKIPDSGEDMDRQATEEQTEPSPEESIAQEADDPTPPGDVESSDDAPRESLPVRWSPRDASERRAVVLVKSQPEVLQLVNEETSVREGDRLISPSPVHTTFSIQSWSCSLAGPSTLEVGTTQSGIQLTTALFRGMLTCDQVGEPLVFITPGGDFSISLLRPQVWIAVEVSHRPVRRGSLLESETTAPAFVVVAGIDEDSGSGPLATIESLDSSDASAIEAPGLGLASIDGEALVEFTLNNPPRWYGRRSVRHIDQEASADFAALLQSQPEVGIGQISGLASDRRPEVAALAIQTSMILGNWAPMASELLRADRLRVHWTSSLSLARHLLAADPAAAESLSQELTQEYGDEAQILFDLILGLPKEQHTNEGLAQLIRRLESDSLPIRVTAAFEMFNLTRQDHGYLPHAPVRASIQQFRRQLTTGRLTIPAVGDPIWERTVEP